MQSVHLIILIHGLYGSTTNLSAVEEELLALASSSSSNSSSTTSASRSSNLNSSSTSSASGSTTTPIGSSLGGTSAGAYSEETRSSSDGQREKNSMETIVYLPKGIKAARTWDGVDVCAYRIAEEVDREVERLQDEGKDVVGFSVMGYSLGGLIGRYLIGILHARQPSFFARHKPVSFSTAATPHLGVLKYGTLTNTVVHTVGRQLFSRTGRQIYCLDKEAEWGGRGLLEIMADPDHVFIQALRAFPKVMIVANGTQDLTVPYPTASISSFDPFSDPSSVHIEADESHIIQSYRHIYTPDPVDLPVNHSTEIDPEDGEEVQVKITVVKSPPAQAAIRGAGGRVRQPLPPPFMALRWPFNYLLYYISPLFVPLILVYLAVAVTIHNVYSKRRIRSHRDALDRQPLLVPSTTSLARDRNSFELPSTTSSSLPISSSTTDLLLDAHTDSNANAFNDFGESTSVLRSIDGTSTPPLSEPASHSSSAPLLLTPAQKLMITNLNKAIPHAERVIAWFPWAYNSHAMLVCRDSARFPWTEDGRGVVRRWAKFAYEGGMEVLHVSATEDQGMEIHGRSST